MWTLLRMLPSIHLYFYDATCVSGFNGIPITFVCKQQIKNYFRVLLFALYVDVGFEGERVGSTVFDNGVSKEQGYLVPIIQSYTDITRSILYKMKMCILLTYTHP